MELRSGKILPRTLSFTDMKGEELKMPLLPEELVEIILAMVPFPQIFKARALSKSWYARLSAIPSHDDKEKKLLAVSFQKRVCEWSGKWRSWSPIFLLDDFLAAYDHASQHWLKVPTLSALLDRETMKVEAHTPRHSMIAGALLLVTSSDPVTSSDLMFVVNMFTKSWKKLPTFPRVNLLRTRERLVCTKEMYKVISLYTGGGYACAWIYDSKLGAWRRKKLKVPDVAEHRRVGKYDVYLNGVLYVIVNDRGRDWGFLTFDVERETFNLIQMLPIHLPSVHYYSFCPLVECNGTVYSLRQAGPILVEADFGTRRWSKAIRGSPAAIKFGFISQKTSSEFDFSVRKASSNGDCLFFEGRRRDNKRTSGKVLAYNVRKDEWSYFATNPMLKTCSRFDETFQFNTSWQPGMNPFLEV